MNKYGVSEEKQTEFSRYERYRDDINEIIGSMMVYEYKYDDIIKNVDTTTTDAQEKELDDKFQQYSLELDSKIKEYKTIKDKIVGLELDHEDDINIVESGKNKLVNDFNKTIKLIQSRKYTYISRRQRRFKRRKALYDKEYEKYSEPIKHYDLRRQQAANTEIQAKYADLVDRYKQIQDLEQSIIQTSQLMRDLAILVDQQTEQLDSISINVNSARDDIAESNARISRAIEIKKSERKLGICIICMCLTLVICIIGGALYDYYMHV